MGNNSFLLHHVIQQGHLCACPLAIDWKGGVYVCVSVWIAIFFFSIRDLLALQFIGDKVQGGGKGGGIKDGVSLELGRGVGGESVYPPH